MLAMRKVKLRLLNQAITLFFAIRGCSAHISSGNGLEFISSAVKKWLEKADVETLYIASGSSWENGYIGLFNCGIRCDVF